ncbi:hypothetical protein [Zavarzinia compransoris]|uniref:Head decoration protein n=1 Tax=Zavarzinia compransoris TaxID=1264899 RepID=A0A317DXN0_9PROT|nr:hypothetical protein [Zavarzinia compransoris]PWR19144.1 hypothetical protein DKG75_19520 [Zavarzinia compransoris]TDP49158.1 hypothetical protein DES42_101526 [Zavarzinia compransoris]
MTMRDLKSNLDPAHSLAPAVRTAGATGSAVDLRGFDAASVLVHAGAYTDGTHTPGLEASADGIAYDDVAAGHLIGAFAAISSGAGANTVQQVGYAGPARYLRAKLTIAGATGGAAAGITILRHRTARAGV